MHQIVESSAERAIEERVDILDNLPLIKHIRFKVIALLLLLMLSVGGVIFYLLYARGIFDLHQRLVLISDDSEGVNIGMDLTFSGFPIGKVQRIELAEDGRVRILVDINQKDAHWLRTSSVFTMESAVVGGTKIRAYSGVLTDPALPDNAERAVLRGDTAAEIPKVVAMVKELVENLNRITQEGSSINQSFANLKTLTDTLNQPQGAMKVLLGNEKNIKNINASIENIQTILKKIDAMAYKADIQIFGDGNKTTTQIPLGHNTPTKVQAVTTSDPNTQNAEQIKDKSLNLQKTATQIQGILPSAQVTIQELNTLLVDTKGSLKRLDLILNDVHTITTNTKEASTDLNILRAQVQSNLNKVDILLSQLNRTWPFAPSGKEHEVKLP